MERPDQETQEMTSEPHLAKTKGGEIWSGLVRMTGAKWRRTLMLALPGHVEAGVDTPNVGSSKASEGKRADKGTKARDEGHTLKGKNAVRKQVKVGDRALVVP